MNAVSLSEAQQRLVELVHDLAHEGDLLITEHDRPVARLSPVNASGLTSLRDLKPSSIGAVLRPFPALDDDLLGEMLHTPHDRG